MPKRAHSIAGFSLIELMIVVIIVGIVFGTAITTYRAAQTNSRDSKRQADIRTIQSSLQQYYADNQNYPVSLDLVNNANISSGSNVYLNNIPMDPLDSQSYCYSSVVSQADPTSPCTDASNCQSYVLYVQLENPPSGSGGSSYTCSYLPNIHANPHAAKTRGNFNLKLSPP